MNIAYARSDKFEKKEQLAVKPWYFGDWDVYLEPLDPEMAADAAVWIEEICRSERFGYSQKDRWSGFYDIQRKDYQIDEAEGYFDCSSLVISVYIYAGLKLDPIGYTGNLEQIFLRTGLFRAYKDDDHLGNPDFGCCGGIYLRSSGHVVFCLENGPMRTRYSTKDYSQAKKDYKAYQKEKRMYWIRILKESIALIKEEDITRFRFAEDGVFDIFGDVEDHSMADHYTRYGLADGRLERIDNHRIYCPVSEIPDRVKKVFICYEDRKFYHHRGCNFKGLVRALVNNLTGGRTQGASTLTMQLVKLLFLNRYSRDIGYKLMQIYLAILMEKHFSKDQILELYLNTIYLANNRYGLASAARFYFDKKVSELTFSECNYLGVISQRPVRCDPLKAPGQTEYYRKERVQFFRYHKLISEKQFVKALNATPRLHCKKDDRVDVRGYDEIYAVEYNWYEGKFSQNVQTVFDKLQESRLSPAAIAGIMGNIHVESAFAADAERRLGKTGAVGIIQWTGARAEGLKKSYPDSWQQLESQTEYLLTEFDKDSPYADSDGIRFYELALEDSQRSPEYYSDLFQALVERNVNRDHYMEEVTVNTAKGSVEVRGRLSKEPNQYDGRYYLDADRRRNYAKIYADCISSMTRDMETR